MTPQETQDWYSQVKGQKIRWTAWSDDNFFIPERLIGLSHIHGKFYDLIHGPYVCTLQTFNIARGFTLAGNGECWKLVQQPQTAATPQPTISASGVSIRKFDPSVAQKAWFDIKSPWLDNPVVNDFLETVGDTQPRAPAPKVCCCQMRDLMRQGCKCGGV